MLLTGDITNFTAGELSPRLKGRIDVAQYFAGADTLLNMVVLPQGGATRRPGTLYVANNKDQANAARLVPFIFSTIQAYILELSALNARIYKDRAVVLNLGVPVDVALPYAAADLPSVKWTQSADTLYLVHPKFPPATLTRSSHTSWTYAQIAFRDGPYLAQNVTSTTLTPSGTTGSINVTASSTIGINGGQGWLTTDVGRLIRIRVSTKWGWCKITSRTSSTVVVATVQAQVVGTVNGADGQLDGTTATTAWRLGKWSDTTGWPYTVTFWQQRLWFGGTDNEPGALEGSIVADFTAFSPSDASNTVTASHSISWVISDDQVNAIRWLSSAGSSAAAALAIGTSGGEHIMQAASTSSGLAPTNVLAYRESQIGSAPNVPVLRIGKALIFANVAQRKLHEFTFDYVVNGYTGPDRMQLSEHISRGLISEIVYQQTPHQVIWCRRADGGLFGITYDRDQKVFAPHRHQLGGDYYGGPPVVEGIAVIPSSDATYSELWLTVLRTINGTPVRFVEVMTKYFDAMPTEQGFFVDAGLSSSLVAPAASLTITGLTANNPTDQLPHTKDATYTGTGTATASAAVFSAGSVGSILRANGGRATVTGFTDTQNVTIEVTTAMTSLAPAASGAWTLTARSTSFSGLGHLNGETAALLGDGAVYPSAPVSAGSVAITDGSPGASFLTAGLPYAPVLITMPFEPQRGAPNAAAGRSKRIDTLWLRFHETLGCDFGRRLTDPMTKAIIDTVEPLQSRTAGDVLGQSPPLFSGSRQVAPPGGFDAEGQILVTQEEPLPLTVVSIFTRAEAA